MSSTFFIHFQKNNWKIPGICERTELICPFIYLPLFLTFPPPKSSSWPPSIKYEVLSLSLPYESHTSPLYLSYPLPLPFPLSGRSLVRIIGVIRKKVTKSIIIMIRVFGPILRKLLKHFFSQSQCKMR